MADYDLATRSWLRALGMVPVVVLLGWFEYTHTFGGILPVVFLMLFAAVVLAAMVGGRFAGLVAALLVSAEIIHCHMLGIGPQPLTGALWTALLGSCVFCATGYLLGSQRDRLDRVIVELGRHGQGLEADLRDQTSESEQSRSEAARHEARLRTAFRLARLGHFEFDTVSGDCIFCSPLHAAHFGLTPQEFMDETQGWDPRLGFVHPDDRQKVLATIKRVRAGEDIELEYRSRTRNGELRYIREIVEPVFDEKGVVVREVGTSMDLTNIRLAETKLRESQKLEAVGRLTAGVAHDFNNLLAVIMGNLELLSETESEADRAEMIKAALGATDRGAALTSQLLSFGRKSMLQPEPLDLCMAINELGTLFRRTLPASIKIEMPGIAGQCLAYLDRSQFEAAMLNLVLNASDAMPSGGTLRIDGAHRYYDAETLGRMGLDLEPGDYIGLHVTDTGTGMTDAVRDRALEPFFTTKSVGKGTGLGLSMVVGFVKQSGGDVAIATRVGEGTTVTLYFKALPVTAKPRPAVGEVAGARKGEGALVLLVEDDENVRKVVARQIVSLGYRVLEAEDAQRALDVLTDNPEVALVLSDVVMPGKMQGTDLVRRARDMRPDLKCVLISGYHDVPPGTNAEALLDVPRLTKPIGRAELGACLADAIGS